MIATYDCMTSADPQMMQMTELALHLYLKAPWSQELVVQNPNG